MVAAVTTQLLSSPAVHNTSFEPKGEERLAKTQRRLSNDYRRGFFFLFPETQSVLMPPSLAALPLFSTDP